MSRQHSKRKRAFLNCLFWIIDFYYLFSYFFSVAPRNSCILVHRIIHSLRSRHRRHNGLAREKCWWKFNVGIQFRSPFCIFTDFYVHFTLITTALFLDRLPLSTGYAAYFSSTAHAPSVRCTKTRNFRNENIFEILRLRRIKNTTRRG